MQIEQAMKVLLQFTPSEVELLWIGKIRMKTPKMRGKIVFVRCIYVK